MDHKKKAVHRLRMALQQQMLRELYEELRHRLPRVVYQKEEAQKKEAQTRKNVQFLRNGLHLFSVNYLPYVLQKLKAFFVKKKAAAETDKQGLKNYQPLKEGCFKTTKTYVTRIEAVDPLDNQLKTFFGPEITAVSEEDAIWLVRNTGLGYCEVIGELIGNYDKEGRELPFGIERLN